MEFIPFSWSHLVSYLVVRLNDKNNVLTGCMKELWVNHKLVDFMNAARQQKVTPGCSLLQDEEQMVEEEGVKSTGVVAVPAEQEQSSTLVDEEQIEPQEGPMDEDDEDEDEDDEIEEDPCYNNQCHKGSKCQPKGFKDYTCKCPPGWSGKFCTQSKSPDRNACESRSPLTPSFYQTLAHKMVFPFSNHPSAIFRI